MKRIGPLPAGTREDSLVRMDEKPKSRAHAGGSEKRDLRTGTPVWLRSGNPEVGHALLEKSITIDVAVVGAGVSGALTVDALLETGLTIAVLDRRGALKGSSPASTALLQFEIDRPLTHLIQKLGRQRAVRAYWRSATAIDALRGRIYDLQLRCSFRERHTAYLPGDVLGVKDLRLEARERCRVGLRSEFIGRDELRKRTSIEAPGAIWSSGSAELDPARLTAGLWRSAIKRGAKIYAPVDVVDVDVGRNFVTLTTGAGHRVRARYVVFATGYELMKLIKPVKYSINSTWAMATAPQPKLLWPTRCLIWQASDPYLYLRTTVDGRVIVGGEDEEFSNEETRDALIPKKIAAIQRKLGRMFPNLDTAAEFSWTGCFGSSDTGLPAIGEIPGSRRCFAILGYGGNGITFSMIAAQLIQRAILGLNDPDADLFALPR
jgi:glycine/D-amino acid oxidase-like deaminating enzyme